MLKKLLFNPFSAIIITVLALLFYLSLSQTIQNTKKSAENVAALEEEVRSLDKQAQELEIQSQANTDFTREEILRNELLLQKPSEFVIQIAIQDVSIPNETAEDTPTSPIFLWKELFFPDLKNNQ